MFCILEELSFAISEALSVLFATYGIKRSSSFSSSNSKSNNNKDEELDNEGGKEEGSEEGNSDFEKPFKAKHDFQMIAARVTEAGQAESGFIHVRSDTSDLTSYKWAESVVLISTEKLSKKKKKANIQLALGVCTLLDTNSAKPECTVYLSPRVQLPIGSEIVLYSLVGFTSFCREFIAVSGLQKNPLRSQWATQLTQKYPQNASKLNKTLASHIDPVRFSISPFRSDSLRCAASPTQRVSTRSRHGAVASRIEWDLSRRRTARNRQNHHNRLDRADHRRHLPGFHVSPLSHEASPHSDHGSVERSGGYASRKARHQHSVHAKPERHSVGPRRRRRERERPSRTRVPAEIRAGRDGGSADQEVPKRRSEPTLHRNRRLSSKEVRADHADECTRGTFFSLFVHCGRLCPRWPHRPTRRSLPFSRKARSFPS